MSDTIDERQLSRTPPARLKRIVMVDVAGVGKTTLARQLALRLSLPYVELDALFWDTNWTQAPLEIFWERVAQALHGNCWVTDGNYSKVRDLTWGQADTIIWLDYGLWTIMTRLLRRTFQRLFMREELWNANRESLKLVFTRDSIILWALKTYSEKRRRYLAAQDDPAYAHLEIIRLCSPQATLEWLAHLPAPSL